jgi:hypothetical protein
MGSGFDDWGYWHFFTIRVNCNSSHIELLLDAVWRTSMRRLSLPWTTSVSRMGEWLSSQSHICAEWPTVTRPAYFGIKHPCGAYDQIFIIVRQLWLCWCEVLSLTRGLVCRLQLLLVLASAVIIGSKSRGTVSDSRFPFRRLLPLAGLRWRYSTPPPHDVASAAPYIG